MTSHIFMSRNNASFASLNLYIFIYIIIGITFTSYACTLMLYNIVHYIICNLCYYVHLHHSRAGGVVERFPWLVCPPLASPASINYILILLYCVDEVDRKLKYSISKKIICWYAVHTYYV